MSRYSPHVEEAEKTHRLQYSPTGRNPVPPPFLVVEFDEGSNQFTCRRKGDTGMCIEGRGLSVAEAVGLWAIYSQTVGTVCDPPSLLDQFQLWSSKPKNKLPRKMHYLKAASR